MFRFHPRPHQLQISLTHFIGYLPYTTPTPNQLASLLPISPNQALSLTNKLAKLNPTANPHTAIKLFEKFHFPIPSIASMITRQPRLLALEPHSQLEPKLKYLQTIGLQPIDITSCPLILRANLDTQLIPNIEILRSCLVTKDNLILTLRKAPQLVIVDDLHVKLIPILQALKDHNVPPHVISTLLVCLSSRILRVSLIEFERALMEIRNMGISVTSSNFAYALAVLAPMPESEWERKLDLYVKLGWSKEQVVFAFVRYPYCMHIRGEKAKKNARFFYEKLQWGAEHLSVHPALLCYSLEKRVIPRHAVWKMLVSKGLLKDKLTPSIRYFMLSAAHFTEKYVMKYHDKAPELLDIMKGQ